MFLFSRGNLIERIPFLDPCTQRLITSHPKQTTAQPPWKPLLHVEKYLTSLDILSVIFRSVHPGQYLASSYVLLVIFLVILNLC